MVVLKGLYVMLLGTYLGSVTCKQLLTHYIISLVIYAMFHERIMRQTEMYKSSLTLGPRV